MLKISVHLLLNPAKYSPTGEPRFEIVLKESTTVGRLFKNLSIPLKPDKVILVNGRQARPDRVLKHEDLVVVFPPMAGG